MTETKNSESKIKILLSVFIISVSLFVYQVVLSRLYSAILSYHYVFLTTSFAVFGLGIGSILAYIVRARKNKANLKTKSGKEPINHKHILKQINRGSIILAASYITVLAFNYLMPFVNNLLVYILLGTLPSLVGGYLYSMLFTEFSGISGKLYFADLIGSGAGSVAVILLLDNAGMFRTIIMVCLIALIPALLLPAAAKKVKAVECILAIALAAGFILPGQYVNIIEKNFSGLFNNGGKTYGGMKKNGLSPEILYSKWNAFSRTDVIRSAELPDEMIVTIDGAANAPMDRFDGNAESLDKYKKDVEFLPFTMNSSKKTLLIGTGGGRDVLYALAGGSKDISAVEINTSSIDAVRTFGEYNGNIYDRPEVKVYGEDGRSFVRKSEDRYDVIFLSLVMTNTSQGMAYALSENYIYTVEAMEDYLDHLSDDGNIAILAHDQDDLNKLVATVMQALQNKGIPVKDAPKYIAVFASPMSQGSHQSGHIHNPMLIVKSRPFTVDESRKLFDEAVKNRNTPVYAPIVYEGGVLQQIKEGYVSLTDYLNGFRRNVTPAADNRPYFYNFGKGIPVTLLIILFLVAFGGVVMFSPFAVKVGNFKPTTYFGLLGIGFMMIETPLIQKFILYLGHPTLAFSFVLAALLVGSGLGGYLSNTRLFSRTFKFFYLPPVMVAIINIILLLSLGFIFETTSALSLAGRIIIASVLVMLQGFFMGMPFPRGLKLVGESGRGEIVPVMWGVNGVASVVGSVLSVILSMTFGFTEAMIAGAVIYLIVSLYKNL